MGIEIIKKISSFHLMRPKYQIELAGVLYNICKNALGFRRDFLTIFRSIMRKFLFCLKSWQKQAFNDPNQSECCGYTSNLYTCSYQVTLYFSSKAWLVDAIAGTMIFALDTRGERFGSSHLRADWTHFNILIDGSSLLLSKLPGLGYLE